MQQLSQQQQEREEQTVVRKWDKKRHEEILHLHCLGKSNLEIARELRTNTFQVSYHLTAEGLNPNNASKLLANPPESGRQILRGKMWLYYCKETAGAGYPWIIRVFDEGRGHEEILAQRVSFESGTKAKTCFLENPPWLDHKNAGHLRSVKAYLAIEGELVIEN